MVDVSAILGIHARLVCEWHEGPITNPFDGFDALVCQQFSFNFRLWHEEDVARSPDVTDQRIAEVKRTIDPLNQQRNDFIEKLDDWITADLERRGVVPDEDARLNTETPGSVIDRLSILALRIYHLEEEAERDDASPEHVLKVRSKLAVCFVQRDDLSQSLSDLFGELYCGQKRHKTYRQFKMYNDPSLNPYLYRSLKAAG